MVTIISSLSCDQNYTVYRPIEGDMNEPYGSVLVKGGRNVADKRSLLAPSGGVITVIEDKDYELLKQCPQFVKHCKDGYLHVEISGSRTSQEEEARKAEKDMKAKDESAQLVPEDFEKNGADAPRSANSRRKRRNANVIS